MVLRYGHNSLESSHLQADFEVITTTNCLAKNVSICQLESHFCSKVSGSSLVVLSLCPKNFLKHKCSSSVWILSASFWCDTCPSLSPICVGKERRRHQRRLRCEHHHPPELTRASGLDRRHRAQPAHREMAADLPLQVRQKKEGTKRKMRVREQ